MGPAAHKNPRPPARVGPEAAVVGGGWVFRAKATNRYKVCDTLLAETKWENPALPPSALWHAARPDRSSTGRWQYLTNRPEASRVRAPGPAPRRERPPPPAGVPAPSPRRSASAPGPWPP